MKFGNPRGKSKDSYVVYSTPGNAREVNCLREAIDDYKRQRENGTPQDNPKWEFPCHGHNGWIDHPPEGQQAEVYCNRYYIGAGADIEWMEEKDFNYLRRLMIEGSLLSVEPNAYKEIPGSHKYYSQISDLYDRANRDMREAEDRQRLNALAVAQYQAMIAAQEEAKRQEQARLEALRVAQQAEQAKLQAIKEQERLQAQLEQERRDREVAESREIEKELQKLDVQLDETVEHLKTSGTLLGLFRLPTPAANPMVDVVAQIPHM
jgi:hypothetical protein